MFPNTPLYFPLNHSHKPTDCFHNTLHPPYFHISNLVIPPQYFHFCLLACAALFD
ncbi:unnamed protein product [Meloidogyne enterolobii]|uniref:Uncharacterized protein n=1 Tax=Meloidogyne enterolobii TaxID=390850 RepID=A0ACB1AK31_MELEN